MAVYDRAERALERRVAAVVGQCPGCFAMEHRPKRRPVAHRRLPQHGVREAVGLAPSARVLGAERLPD
jgi:hypothetical protein